MSDEARKEDPQSPEETRTSELSDQNLAQVAGGKQKPDGTAAGNVAAKWSVAQGAVA